MQDKEYMKKYRSKNREKISKQKKEWKKRNPKKVIEYYKRENEKRKTSPEVRKKFLDYQKEYRKNKVEELKKLIGFKCLICGSTKIRFHEIHGKSHKTANYSYTLKHYKDFVPLCFKCHRAIHWLKFYGKKREPLIKQLLDSLTFQYYTV